MSFRPYIAIIALLGTLGLVSGCGTSVWKSTKDLYTEYLNPPASIDYGDKGTLSEAEAALAVRMRGIDSQLSLLERHLENADRSPSPESVALLFNQFPWISGFAAVDSTGDVLVQEPPMGLKELDFSRIVETGSRGNTVRGLRAMVQDTPLGPEVFAAVPVYNSAELMGLVVTHFDMRALVPFGQQPEDMVVLSPEAVLWPGRFAMESTPLLGKDWRSMVKSSVTGTVSNDTGNFLWVARFLGAEPLIFAVPISGSFMENPAGMDGVTRGSFVGVPASSVPVIESDVNRGGPSLLQMPAPPASPATVNEAPIQD